MTRYRSRRAPARNGAMTDRTLLGSLRGGDGRSLARALVVLILVSLFGSGLNAGAAAAEGRAVICAAVASADGSDPGPDGHLLSDCCLAGVMPLGMGLAALPPEVTVPDTAGQATALPAPAAVAGGQPRGLPPARGPPLSA